MNVESLKKLGESISFPEWLKNRRIILLGLLVPAMAAVTIGYFSLRTEAVQSSSEADQDQSGITIDTHYGQIIHRVGDAFLYVTAPGENTETVSNKFGMAQLDLITANGLRTEIVPGQVLFILQREDIVPESTNPTAEASVEHETEPAVDPVESVNPRIHIVRKGEWLYQIARMYNVNPRALMRANPQFHNPNLIFPGDEVYIPAA